MLSLVKVMIVASLAVTACSSGDVESNPKVSVPPVVTHEPSGSTGSTTDGSTEVPQEEDSTATPTTRPDDVSNPTKDDGITDDDLTRFIAATEVPLQGTSLEGAVLEAPEIYIAIAQLSCARFSEGDTFEEIADDLLAELGLGASDDDERLVGAIIGAATRTICPEHADKI